MLVSTRHEIKIRGRAELLDVEVTKRMADAICEGYVYMHSSELFDFNFLN